MQIFLSIKVCLPYRVTFYLILPIFILQMAHIPKNWVQLCQQSNSDNRTGVETSYNLVRQQTDKEHGNVTGAKDAAIDEEK